MMREQEPLLVHWAVAKNYGDGDGYVPMPEPIRVVEVGPKPGWPQMGDWYEFACGSSWIAVRASFAGSRLVDYMGQGDWPYSWCQSCRTAEPVNRDESDWDAPGAGQ